MELASDNYFAALREVLAEEYERYEFLSEQTGIFHHRFREEIEKPFRASLTDADKERYEEYCSMWAEWGSPLEHIIEERPNADTISFLKGGYQENIVRFIKLLHLFAKETNNNHWALVAKHFETLKPIYDELVELHEKIAEVDFLSGTNWSQKDLEDETPLYEPGDEEMFGSFTAEDLEQMNEEWKDMQDGMRNLFGKEQKRRRQAQLDGGTAADYKKKSDFAFQIIDEQLLQKYRSEEQIEKTMNERNLYIGYKNGVRALNKMTQWPSEPQRVMLKNYGKKPLHAKQMLALRAGFIPNDDMITVRFEHRLINTGNQVMASIIENDEVALLTIVCVETDKYKNLVISTVLAPAKSTWMDREKELVGDNLEFSEEPPEYFLKMHHVVAAAVAADITQKKKGQRITR